MTDLTASGEPGNTAAGLSDSALQRRSIFVSYARQDQAKAREMVEGLRVLGSNVWFDEGLVGGQEWWDEILEHIRTCDIFVQALSASATKSAACDNERRYAVALGKHVLPVMLEAIPGPLLPGDVAGLQFIDYVDAGAGSAFKLAAAISDAPVPPQLPDPLPEPPRAPLSYLVALGDKVRSQELSFDEQLAIVTKIRSALNHPEDIDGPDDVDSAERVLHALQARPDVYKRVAEEVDETLARAKQVRESLTRPPDPVPPTPGPGVKPVEEPGKGPLLVNISAHWGFAVTSLFLFLFVGIFAVINASRVAPAVERGDIATAKKASSRVMLYFWICLVLGVLTWIAITASKSGSSSSG
jgi:TIR domain-containing protein/interferon-induced transmembrane protein